MKLFELFDKKYQWAWTAMSPYQWLAEFKLDSGSTVEFAATFKDNEVWNISFDIGDSFRLVRDGKGFRTIGTVIDILHEFIRRKKPDAIEFFSGDDPHIKFYDFLTKKISLPGYKLSRTVDRVGIVFYRYTKHK